MQAIVKELNVTRRMTLARIEAKEIHEWLIITEIKKSHHFSIIVLNVDFMTRHDILTALLNKSCKPDFN